MKSATIEARKRFAADLAVRDEARDTARRARLEAACPDEPEQAILVEKLIDQPKLPPPYTATLAQRLAVEERAQFTEERLAYEMRRFWLDRYTLDEIRELAGCLR